MSGGHLQHLPSSSKRFPQSTKRAHRLSMTRHLMQRRHIQVTLRFLKQTHPGHKSRLKVARPMPCICLQADNATVSEPNTLRHDAQGLKRKAHDSTPNQPTPPTSFAADPTPPTKPSAFRQMLIARNTRMKAEWADAIENANLATRHASPEVFDFSEAWKLVHPRYKEIVDSAVKLYEPQTSQETIDTLKRLIDAQKSMPKSSQSTSSTQTDPAILRGLSSIVDPATTPTPHGDTAPVDPVGASQSLG
jgi:hypothetical protein